MKHLTREDLILIQSYLNITTSTILTVNGNDPSDPHIKIITNLQNKIIEEIRTMKTDKKENTE